MPLTPQTKGEAIVEATKIRDIAVDIIKRLTTDPDLTFGDMLNQAGKCNAIAQGAVVLARKCQQGANEAAAV